MPFGLKYAPQIFQIKMDEIFFEYSTFIIKYIDDILVYYENEKDHEKHLDIFITLVKNMVSSYQIRRSTLKEKK